MRPHTGILIDVYAWNYPWVFKKESFWFASKKNMQDVVGMKVSEAFIFHAVVEFLETALTFWVVFLSPVPPMDGNPDFSILVVFMKDFCLNELGRMLTWINLIRCPNFGPGIRMLWVELAKLPLLSLIQDCRFPFAADQLFLWLSNSLDTQHNQKILCVEVS